MTDHQARLQETGEAYQRAKEEAKQIVRKPRDELAEAARQAYADGVKKADILRWSGHAWSDTWLNTILDGVERKTDQTT
ncbi:hypothetical protein [Micromonospora costi]|uniref:Uncharacterized protein n=1 Tax=Micromonospora costi TaxID=1530042 RepID=A0A3B0A5H9_9ACTN|nr:hypothetical protein [Micromonospora costi]RKN56008.1 hypothetical protein D7193_15600 [Micromonospora costi]